MSRDLNTFCKNPEASKAKGGLNLNEIVQELAKRGLDWTGKRTVAAARLCNAIKNESTTVNPPVTETKVKEVKVKEVKVKVKVKVKAAKKPELRAKDRYVSDHTAQLKIISTYDPKRRMIYLSGPVLRQFSNFVKAEIEFGGMIDINKDGSFDRAMFGIGMKRSVKLSDMLDFEVIFHTHPSGRTMFMFEQPSTADFKFSMHASTISGSPKHQVHIVFTPEGVYTIYVPNTKDYKNPSIEDAIKAMGEPVRNDDELYYRIEDLAKLGIYVFRYSKVSRLTDVEEPINNWPDSIPLYIDPKEPIIEARKRGVRTLTPQDRQAQQLKDALQRAQDKQKSERAKLWY